MQVPVRAAVNIGPSLAAALTRAGIADLDTLQRLGVAQAWERIIRAQSGQARTVWLYAIEGAIRGVRWTALDEHERRELRQLVGRDVG